ncbi:cobalt-precorrin-5B (C(1))-methyltransferase CbiD [Ignavigranum ruoffiae]|uniref:Cobalt-precorrin-5B C(1)-methyltransferase n=1 Tax=Ignavigranum ruoffiae TaxID=89093 RepID=A0A1H9CEZ6_9LACT|nr:cobalt-precorrin-5B (C(1))-methyltransferase CbiD [Ignavigranum ruoffiae]SEP99621.1 cobalt-precorrin 5B C1-methyltransferase [Ignavigranum ruoffiae]
MEEYISYNGKKLRKGYTTGSCATAATIAAVKMLIEQKRIDQVKLIPPAGVELIIPIYNCLFNSSQASCSVIKDGGDDADATHGMHIYSTVTWNNNSEIEIIGGEGVGVVTQEGLAIPVGEAAINPVPRQMISSEVQKLLPKDVGLTIEISAPGGEDVARGTMNPRLGIMGGISILGTTGIVTPMSEEGWKQSITIEMEQKKKIGFNKIILTPGNYGEEFIIEKTKLNKDYMVQMSNFVGYVLLEAMRLEFEEILLVGHLGKFIKIAGGIFSTHSKDADARNEIMIANLALMGAPLSLLEEVDKSLTTEKQAELIIKAGYEQVYQRIVQKIKSRILKLYQFRAPHIKVEVITFLTQNEIIVSTRSLEELEKLWQ